MHTSSKACDNQVQEDTIEGCGQGQDNAHNKQSEFTETWTVRTALGLAFSNNQLLMVALQCAGFHI